MIQLLNARPRCKMLFSLFEMLLAMIIFHSGKRDGTDRSGRIDLIRLVAVPLYVAKILANASKSPTSQNPLNNTEMNNLWLNTDFPFTQVHTLQL